MYHDLALYAEEAHDPNEEAHLKPLTNYFRAAILLLTAEIAAWVIGLALPRMSEMSKPKPIVGSSPMRPFPGDGKAQPRPKHARA